MITRREMIIKEKYWYYFYTFNCMAVMVLENEFFIKFVNKSKRKKNTEYNIGDL